MTRTEPTAEVMVHSLRWDRPEEFRAERYTPTGWERAQQGLAEADTYWLATVTPDARPHVVPVLAVWVDGALHFCASDTSRKAAHLARNPHCTVTTQASGLDLVVEGRVAPVTEPARLRRVAETYTSKYDWHPEVRDRALWGDGAPTAGPPPYRVYEVTPALAFGLPTAEDVVPTRWRF